MAHALDGMPQCRHCRHKFSTWHAFHYHVNSQSCAGLRMLDQDAQAKQAILPLLTEAVVATQSVLDKARDCTWQDLALMPEVRAKHHHCVECNHWSVAPQYVRRHMTQRHPECADLIQKCIQDIKASRLGLQNPCQFCGQSYKRRMHIFAHVLGVQRGLSSSPALSRQGPDSHNH